MACPPGLTKDGYEIQFGTNHVGHALLTKILLPVLLKTAQLPGADVRIILLTSFAYESAPGGGILFKDLKTVQDNFLVAGPWRRYGQSKLADLLYAAELARRYPQITALAIHPGTINTGLASNLNLFNKGVFYMKTWRTLVNSDEGVWNQLWAVSANKKDLVNGAYYVPVGVNEALKTKDAKNEALAEELWTWTQKELEGY
jgi:NAD(P)-dependent dehydrogenase (short-subunit alcohol dehydrogenase family)